MTRLAAFTIFLSVLSVFGFAAAQASEPAAAKAEFFEREIRPLLIQHCYKCHGDLAEPKGGLKLTSREAVLTGGESGPAAVDHKPHESLLISAVNYDGIEMPPDGKKLTGAEIARLTRWVEIGMPWPVASPQQLAAAHSLAEQEQIAAARRDFWSFKPVANPPLPAVSDSAWPKTSLDHFVLAELDKKKLTPSPAADKRTMLRRLSFDLIGLPPTPAEMEAFLADDSPQAVERVVDRLLASPHYGERWGRHWLDVARYADTKGYVLFQDANFPWSYTYRDYVVRAFNEDLPYNRFIVEQLAADRLDLGRDRRPLTALGFLTLGSGFMNNQQDVIDDRIDVVTRGLLGLTVSCARCHDHKFDPIPTKDYYSLYGVLASSVEPTVPPLFEDPPQTPEYAAFAAELAKLEQELTAYIDKKFRDLRAAARDRVGEYLISAQAMRERPPTEEFMLLADGNDLNPTMIIRYQAFLERSAKHHDPVWAVWHALAKLPEKEFAAQAAATIDRLVSEQTSGQTGEEVLNPLVVGAFLGKPLQNLGDAARIYGELLNGAHRQWLATVERAKTAQQAVPTSLADANLEALRQGFDAHDAPANATSTDFNVLALLPDRAAQGERTKLLKAVEDWRATGPAAPPRAMALEDLPQPMNPRIFVRGNPNVLGEEVPRRFLRVLSQSEPAPFVNGSGRLGLAEAIANRDNPLTARVLVNRVWLEHFGTPLVRTPSDFGLRSQPPTHPELLDHLAWNFMEQGWSIKWLHRQIVLSAVYSQTSEHRADCAQVDPENTLFWKMNRRRLDFETMRDALLATSGRLDEKLGGPPVPDIVGPAATRRTLYGQIDRLNLPGLFRTFDFPNPDQTSPERSLTTVPQQSLFFMNSPLLLEAAKSLLARPDVTSLAQPEQKIARLYQLTFSRSPTADELAATLEFVGPADTRPAAWTELAQGLLAANEFLFID